MSVKMSVVRIHQAFQVMCPVPLQAVTDNSVVKEYAYFQAFFHGFTGGARSRMKNFSSQFKLLCYLNKLHQGGWMTSDDYTDAWSAAMELNGPALRLRILDDVS